MRGRVRVFFILIKISSKFDFIISHAFYHFPYADITSIGHQHLAVNAPSMLSPDVAPFLLIIRNALVLDVNPPDTSNSRPALWH
jgi:hypothetical protein